MSEGAPRPRRSRTLAEVQARKRELVGRAAGERRALAEGAEGLAPALAAGDRALGVVRGVLLNPVVLVGGGLLLLVLFPRLPRRALAVATRGIALWNGVRAAQRLIAPRS